MVDLIYMYIIKSNTENCENTFQYFGAWLLDDLQSTSIEEEKSLHLIPKRQY